MQGLLIHVHTSVRSPTAETIALLPWSSPQVMRTTQNPGPFWASFWLSPPWDVLPKETKPACRTCTALFCKAVVPLAPRDGQRVTVGVEKAERPRLWGQGLYRSTPLLKNLRVCAASPLGVTVGHVICGF